MTFPRVTSLLNYSDFGTKGVGHVKHSFCCHEIGMTTDKSSAFPIEKSTRAAHLEMKKDREEMRRFQVKWHMKYDKRRRSTVYVLTVLFRDRVT